VAISSARANNASALVGQHLLEPLPNNAGQFPATVVPVVWFPNNRNNLMRGGAANLTTARANALLVFYGLPVAGTLEGKRNVIGGHIGVRL